MKQKIGLKIFPPQKEIHPEFNLLLLQPLPQIQNNSAKSKYC